MKRYLATFEYGKATLVRFEVAKETEKTYQVKPNSEEKIIGWNTYVGRVKNKADQDIFDTAQGAVDYLITKAELHREEMEKALAEAGKQVDRLLELAQKLKGLEG